MDEKVSVIIPIYKVEKYIHRCIDSVINQSYRNLEIILVDDGSPDNCGKIIDEYKKSDIRVISLHKKNGGLSDARNYGLRFATGDYIYFLDSDDYINNLAIEKLIYEARKQNADIVQGAFYYDYGTYFLYDNRYFDEMDKAVELDNLEAMKELLINEKIKNFAWGKLYKKGILDGIEFKKDVFFEDVFWAHKVFKRVKKYVIIHEPLYYYVQRENSISGNYSLKNLDLIKGLKERLEFTKTNYKDLVDESYNALTKACLQNYNLLFLNKKKFKDKKYRNEIKKYVNENYEEMKNACKNDYELLKQLELFYRSPSFNITYLMFIKIFRKLKLIKNEKGLKKIDAKEFEENINA